MRTSLLAAVLSPRKALGDPSRWMFFSTRIRQASGSAVNVVAGAEYKSVTLKACNGPWAKREVKVHFPGFWSLESGAAPTEQTPGAMAIDEVFIIVGANSYPMLFTGASTSVSIAAGALGEWASVTLPEDLPANAQYTLKYSYHQAAGVGMIPGYNLQTQNGERAYGATTLAGVQALSAANGASSANMAGIKVYGPDFAIAKGWDGVTKVQLVANDSIGDERNDGNQNADARGNQGVYRRYLDNAASRVCFAMMSCPGAAGARDLITGAFKRWQVLDEIVAFNGGKYPWTGAINQYGQNDMSASGQAGVLAFIDRLVARYPGTKVVGCTLLPVTTSNDNWKTRTGQTKTTVNIYPTGAKYVFNDYVRAGMDGRLVGFIDTYAPVHDATYPGTWPAAQWTGTLAAQAGTDGTATYVAITVNGPPPPSLTFIGWGTPGASNTAHTGGITDIVDNGNGTYTLNIDRTNTQVAAVGTAVWSMASADGTHPEEITCEWLAGQVPQSAKTQLV